MKDAVIDIGTNSVRMIIAEIEKGQMISSLKYMEVTRLGQGVDESKLLSEAGMQRTCDAISKFCKMALRQDCLNIYLMATSAVRDAQNKADFLQRVKEETARDVDVISGELEAEVGFLGVLKGSKNPKSTHMVIDIGGGSTEIIVGNQWGRTFSKSFNMGAVRMTDRFTEEGRYTDQTVQQIETFVRATIEADQASILSLTPQTAVGIGGTATSFCTMLNEVKHYSRDRVHNQIIKKEDIKNKTHELLKMTADQREKVVGLDAKRADIIGAGGIILYTLLEIFKIDNLVISDFDNLEGYLFYKIES